MLSIIDLSTELPGLIPNSHEAILGVCLAIYQLFFLLPLYMPLALHQFVSKLLRIFPMNYREQLES